MTDARSTPLPCTGSFFVRLRLYGILGAYGGTTIRDTHKTIGNLQKRGFTAQQAEGIADAFKEIDTAGLATKADINDLRQEIRAMALRLYRHVSAILIAHGLGTAALTVALLQLIG